MGHLPTQSVRNRLRMSSNGIEAVVSERIDQFLDRRRPMVEEIRGEQVAKVGPAHRQQLAHRQTMAWRSDTARSSLYCRRAVTGVRLRTPARHVAYEFAHSALSSSRHGVL